MNADLASDNGIYPPIQLKYRYERLVKAQEDQLTATNNQVYADAKRICEQQIPVDNAGNSRAQCAQEYVDAHGAKTQPINDALYKFNFASPLWSPDIAGWSVVIASVFLILFILRISLELWLRRSLDN
jgi:hypothetical protein